MKTTDTVQIWNNGVMTCVISQTEAYELVRAGTYREINDRAIEWIQRT